MRKALLMGAVMASLVVGTGIASAASNIWIDDSAGNIGVVNSATGGAGLRRGGRKTSSSKPVAVEQRARSEMVPLALRKGLSEGVAGLLHPAILRAWLTDR